MNLIINCSLLKNPGTGLAKDIYRGPVLTLGIEYAKIYGWVPLILSTKYGIITPTTIIESHEMRMTKPYNGPWPQGRGFWLGSKKYFARVPDHIIRLLPEGWSYGQQKSYLSRIVNPERYSRSRVA